MTNLIAYDKLGLEFRLRTYTKYSTVPPTYINETSLLNSNPKFAPIVNIGEYGVGILMIKSEKKINISP